jgi:hypothetical protein
MAVNRRARRAVGAARLPRWAYVVREKHLRRFRTLARQLTDGRVGPHTTFDGLVNMGEDGNEIWVEASLSEPEKRFTIVHELVHARRQRTGEDLDDDTLEEQIVELETIARVGRRTLGRMPSGVTLSILHDYLTRGGRDDPETPAGLRAIYRRIWALLEPRHARLRGRYRRAVSRRASRRR